MKNYLQCTTIGPASKALAAAEFRTNDTRGRACKGTPWSGQAVKWYWYTVRSKVAICFLEVVALGFMYRMEKVLKVYEAKMSSRKRLTNMSP